MIYAPPESYHLHAIDLATGHARWQKRVEDAEFITVADGRVLLISPLGCDFLDAATGTVVRERAAFPQGLRAAGRGYVAAGGYFQPFADGSLGRLDLQTAQCELLARTHSKMPLGNLLWHENLLFSVGSDGLRAYDDLDALRDRITTALAADPTDPEALLRRADLHSAAGQHDAAVIDARAAWQAMPTPHSRNRLITALLDGLRHDLPNAAAYDAELDALSINATGIPMPQPTSKK